jgi:hypothetical protein
LVFLIIEISPLKTTSFTAPFSISSSSPKAY